MKTLRLLGLAVGILLTGGTAGAQIRTVVQTMNYYDNVNFVTAPFFAVPNTPPNDLNMHLDMSPYYRTNIEDWPWTHDVASVRPGTALGIQKATLTITAWDVGALADGEDHVIYIGGGLAYNYIYDAWLYDRTGVRLGLLKSFYEANVTVPWPATGQRADYASLFSRTTFNLPESALNTLWNDNELTFWIDIDQADPNGNKVTLIDSSLAVEYIIPGPPAGTLPVHRFWSPVLGAHFYTIDDAERQWLIDNYSDVWSYEGVAYNALPLDTTNPDALPVFRFWSAVMGGHFYTMDPAERDQVMRDWPEVWTYEGPVFYAFPEGKQPADTYPIHRFWSAALHHHFYTMNEAEKQWLIENYPNVWSYEGIVWYAFVP